MSLSAETRPGSYKIVAPPGAGGMGVGSVAMTLRKLGALAAFGALAACAHREPQTFQGYAEGEFVYVGSPVGGRLEKLFVARGHSVEAQAPLFELESTQEAAGVSQAQQTLRAAEAHL